MTRMTSDDGSLTIDVPDGDRPYLGNVQTLRILLEGYTHHVMAAYDAFLQGREGADVVLPKIEATARVRRHPNGAQPSLPDRPVAGAASARGAFTVLAGTRRKSAGKMSPARGISGGWRRSASPPLRRLPPGP